MMNLKPLINSLIATCNCITATQYAISGTTPAACLKACKYRLRSNGSGLFHFMLHT